ncbi:TetR family transcriptional regulator [Tamaricihabitans halophyticus]|uniref:TetR family transcriptional regulator n=1 Tax=Tamaricihabitans halophyticus TaxID=1262583 RepID=A0A4R2QY21_9PSEU|nr:TetR/AcrR family transcriptional regulator [Tamaricihabitans halophyticus]TCP55073.1 TetR family transcriptional regulator [Tamaricihabitans halophyticus]
MRARRLDYSEATRTALVDGAVELFTKHGYAQTSLDQIAKHARVTKGALYHHFGGKQALFEAAFDRMETVCLRRVGAVLEGDGSPWERAKAGLRVFIEICLEPGYQRIVVHEAPVVMGWERWREAEENFGFGLVRAGVRLLIDAGEVAEVPVEVSARLLYGALCSAAELIASSTDQQKVGEEVADTIERLLEQIRSRPQAG